MKSGFVSRNSPRSRPTTLTPARVSSLERIPAVHPTPIMTASTDFSVVAISGALRLAASGDDDRQMLDRLVAVHRKRPLHLVGHAHRLDLVRFVVLFDRPEICG